MPEGKKKFIEDAARVIEGRVAALKAELERNMQMEPQSVTIASDRAAIMEAEFCANLVRQLQRGAYRGEPYDVAWGRWARHGNLGPAPAIRIIEVEDA